MLEEGRGRTQVRGGPVLETVPGQPWWTAAGVEHWHGAAGPGRAPADDLRRRREVARAGERQGVPDGAAQMKRAWPSLASASGSLLALRGAGSAIASRQRRRPPTAPRSSRATARRCHDGATGSRAPSPDLLKRRSPEAILSALTAGGMRPQGGRLSGAERRAVAEYLSGRALGSDITGAAIGRCTASPPLPDPASSPAWRGWSPSITNTRFQPAQQAGLSRRAGAEALAEMGVRISRRHVGVVAADRGERPRVRRQPERDRLLARREERLHLLDVHREERRAHGAGVRAARRARTATRCTSATPARTSTRSTRRPDASSGRAGSTSIRTRGSPARRRSIRIACTCRSRRWKRPRPASRATSAAPSAAA